MKPHRSPGAPPLLVLLLFVSLLFVTSEAYASTGLQAEQVAERVISPRVKGHLIWARSKDSVSSDPQSWDFLYFDPYADSNGRMVEISGDAIVRIDEGLVDWDKARLFPYKESEVIPVSMVRVDSNQALARVQAVGGIGQVRLTRVDYVLAADPVNDTPSWQLTLYAVRRDTGDEIKLGKARVSAATGQIFGMDLKLERLH